MRRDEMQDIMGQTGMTEEDITDQLEDQIRSLGAQLTISQNRLGERTRQVEHLAARVKALEIALEDACDIAESWVVSELDGTSQYREAIDEIGSLRALSKRGGGA